MNINGFRHIIWDWNGTLLDDAWLTHSILNGIRRDEDLPELTLNEFRDRFCFPVETFYRATGFDLENRPFSERADRFIAEYQSRFNQCRLHAGALDILEETLRGGRSQSIVSAHVRSALTAALETLGLQDHFSGVAAPEDIGGGSKTDMARAWRRSLPFPGEQILFIGDTDHDCEDAREIGVRCALVAQGYQSRSRLVACGAPVFESLAQLRDSPGF